MKPGFHSASLNMNTPFNLNYVIRCPNSNLMFVIILAKLPGSNVFDKHIFPFACERLIASASNSELENESRSRTF